MTIEVMTNGLMTNGLMTTGSTNCAGGGDTAAQNHLCATVGIASEMSAGLETVAPEPAMEAIADSWRVEVAARLERYRTRRKPRTPRYPSLLLPFDAPESWSRTAPLAGSAVLPARVEQDFAFQTNFPANERTTAAEALSFTEACPSLEQALERRSEQGSEQAPTLYPDLAPEQSAKVIEFPRSAAIPVFHRSELADPVFDLARPRIVEAPEVLPPPPALGGMLIEPAEQEMPGERADIARAVPSASIAKRALATLVDGAILLTALAAFAAIVLHLNPSLNPGLNFSLIRSLDLRLISLRGPLPLFAGALVGIAALLWAAYEFLFVVYTGSTPGLRAARLRLAAFDGSPLNRRARRWRVLASFLSAFSAGLGYLWCILDQDGLCWHDRITRTHVQPQPPAEKEKPRPLSRRPAGA